MFEERRFLPLIVTQTTRRPPTQKCIKNSGPTMVLALLNSVSNKLTYKLSEPAASSIPDPDNIHP
jgi:hypothetical protein